MSNWQIEKNKLDFLQEYQVVFSAVFAVPFAIVGAAMAAGFNINNFIFGICIAAIAYFLLSDKKTEIEEELAKVKQRVDRLKK